MSASVKSSEASTKVITGIRYEAEVPLMRHEISALRHQMHNMEKKYEDDLRYWQDRVLELELSKVESEIANTNRVSQELVEERAERAQEREQHDLKIAQLESRSEAQEEEICSLRSQLEDRDTCITRLHEELQNLKKQMEQQESALQSQVQSLQTKVDEKQQAYEKLVEEREAEASKEEDQAQNSEIMAKMQEEIYMMRQQLNTHPADVFIQAAPHLDMQVIFYVQGFCQQILQQHMMNKQWENSQYAMNHMEMNEQCMNSTVAPTNYTPNSSNNCSSEDSQDTEGAKVTPDSRPMNPQAVDGWKDPRVQAQPSSWQER